MVEEKRIKTKSLRLQVYRQLLDSLLKETWKVGEKLPSEHELCKMFSVSRSTVRSAIQQLEIQGLVETRQGDGTKVIASYAAYSFNTHHQTLTANRKKDLLYILEYRKVVETGSIAIACGQCSEEDIQYLEEKFNEMRLTKDNPVLHAQADNAFHQHIAYMTRNPILINSFAAISELLSNAIIDIVKTVGCELGLHYHQQLLESLRSKNVHTCVITMEKHIQETIDAVNKQSN